jgi:predicted nucleic acid-binding protein
VAPRVYLETTVVSYLTAWFSRDLVVAARQQITRDWWTRRRSQFELYVSDLVWAEAAIGDADAARRRTEVLEPLPLLATTEEAVTLARAVAAALALPPRAAADALHVAIAACHGIDYLLTWNSTHIANAELRPRVERACRREGYEPPVLCTPDELMGG